MGSPGRLLEAEEAVVHALGASATTAEAGPLVLEALCKALDRPSAALWEAANGPAEEPVAVWPPDAAPRGGIRFAIAGTAGVLGEIELEPSPAAPDDDALRAGLASIGRRLGAALEQRRAEESARASDAHTRAILDASLDCIISMDASGRITEFNPAAERTFGRRRAEALGKDLAELVIPPWLRDAHRTGFARHLEGGRNTILNRRYETVGMRADGSEFPVELAIVRVDHPDGPLFTGTLRDLSERRRLEESLEARVAELQRERDHSETMADTAQSLERFFELSSDLLCTIDREGKIARVNPAFERGLGFRAAALVGRPFIRLVHKDDRTATRGELRAAGRGQPTIRFENRCRRRDGAYRWLEWSAMADPANRVVYAVARDVTEDKRAEERLRALAQEQAALRRVATLVAGEAAESGIFARVTEEAGRLLEAQICTMVRFDEDGAATVVAVWNEFGADALPAGARLSTEGESAIARVRRSGLPDRVDDYGALAGELASQLRDLGIKAGVAAPIWLGGRLWGATVASREHEPFPEGAEQRLTDFSDLVAQALANADAREQLAASRARLVGAADRERRRLERNLHDGAQQRLVALALSLRLALASLVENPDTSRSLLEGASRELSQALEELRELARGIHPAVLSERGLVAALRALAARAPFPVELSAQLQERLPEPVETAAYYVVSESLANVAKYADGTQARVTVSRHDDLAIVEVADDGIGGADATRGTGLRGLADRVEALNGRLEVESEPGEGTIIRALLPC
jgi:PAS domain S-box-containing protein